MGALDWMADALRAAGLTVVEYPGWRGRAVAGRFAPRAVMWHHDASAVGPSPAMAHMIAEVGKTDTAPPLAQCWVDLAGVWHLTAGGRANHAGTGGGWGRVPANAGNTYSIGIETDHTVGEPWPDVQLACLRRGTRVLLDRLGAHASDALCGHKEYTTRKPDPDGLDMAAERQIVAGLNLEADMPLTPQDTNAVWMQPCVGTDSAGNTQSWPAAVWLTVMAFRIADIHRWTAELAGRDPDGVDEVAVAANLAPMLVEALAGQLSTLTPDDLTRIKEAVADELDRRARDDDPDTGPPN